MTVPQKTIPYWSGVLAQHCACLIFSALPYVGRYNTDTSPVTHQPLWPQILKGYLVCSTPPACNKSSSARIQDLLPQPYIRLSRGCDGSSKSHARNTHPSAMILCLCKETQSAGHGTFTWPVLNPSCVLCGPPPLSATPLSPRVWALSTM